jgi:hypothetical protein
MVGNNECPVWPGTLTELSGIVAADTVNGIFLIIIVIIIIS